MMTTNVNDKALGASARHFHIASRSGNDNNNNVDDDNKCLQQGLRRERRAFLYCVAQRPFRLPDKLSQSFPVTS